MYKVITNIGDVDEFEADLNKVVEDGWRISDRPDSFQVHMMSEILGGTIYWKVAYTILLVK